MKPRSTVTPTHGIVFGWSATNRRTRKRLPPRTSNGAFRFVADRGMTAIDVTDVMSIGPFFRFITSLSTSPQSPSVKKRIHKNHSQLGRGTLKHTPQSPRKRYTQAHATVNCEFAPSSTRHRRLQ